MSKSIIKEKSFQFAIRIVKLCKYLTSERKEFVLSKQLLRSGTSIGANVRESQNAESKADFIHKLAIAQKETNYILDDEFQSMKSDASELLKIIRSIIITTKQNNKKKD